MTAVFVEHAAVWENVTMGVPLTAGEETRRAMLLFNLLTLDSANRYMQFSSGYLEAKAWEGRMQILPDLVGYPIYPVWRESGAGRNQSARFLHN